MTTTINASNSGGGGLVQTADASGVLALQTAGTTALSIDASQRTAFVAGTAALPAITTTGDTNTGIFFPAADTIAFSEGGAEAMRIDSSGNLLLGVTVNSNGEKLFVRSGGSTSGTDGIRIENSSATAILMTRDDGFVRMPSTYGIVGGTANLSIDSNGFLTRASSSLRYKRDVVDYDKGLAVLNQLRPVYYKSSVVAPNGELSDTQYAGMIAEELDALGLFEFVEYGEENKIEAIRYGNLVSLCIKAIQEQQALITQQAAAIEALTTRITALEGTPA